MMRRFDGARRILLSPATTLEGLAAAVGLTAEELFDGTDFDGVDLTGEPVELLARINADYAGAILSRRQKRALGDTPVQRRRSRTRIADLRGGIMRRFVEGAFREEHHAVAQAALIDPLRNRSDPTSERPSAQARYAPSAVRFVAAERIRLSVPVADALTRLLGALRDARMPIDHDVLEAWPSDPAEATLPLRPFHLRKLVNFDLCTARFVAGWLDRLGGALAQPNLDGLGRDADFPERRRMAGTGASLRNADYDEALVMAVQGPSRPPATYFEMILGRARSVEELRDLAAAVPPGAVDQSAAATISQMLARGSTGPRAIAATLTDDRLHPRIANAFRGLLAAVGTPEARRALLETIADLGERASGLEVDAVVAGLSVDEAIRMLRPFWDRLTPHHRDVARAALRDKAASPAERARVDALRGSDRSPRSGG